MAENFYTCILPLTVICFIYGFSITDVRHIRLNKIITCYCYNVTVILLLVPLASVVKRLSHITYDFSSALHLVMHIIRAILVAYYRIQFLTNQKVVNDVYSNISHADQLLESHVGVKVPHKWNRIVCALYTVSCAIMPLAALYFFIKINQYVSSIVSEITIILITLENYFMLHSLVIVFMHFTFLLYLINQRLGLFAYAILKDTKRLDERKTAWEGHIVSVSVSVSVCGTLEMRDTSVAKLQDYHKTLQIIYSSIDGAFVSTRNFYSPFVCFSLIISAVLVSLGVFFLTVTKNVTFLNLHILFILLLQVTPILLFVNIKSAFRNTEALIRSIYSSQILKSSNIRIRNIDKFIRKCVYTQRVFDCGYFVVDSNILLLLFNFISLFIFSMLQEQV